MPLKLANGVDGKGKVVGVSLADLEASGMSLTSYNAITFDNKLTGNDAYVKIVSTASLVIIYIFFFWAVYL